MRKLLRSAGLVLLVLTLVACPAEKPRPVSGVPAWYAAGYNPDKSDWPAFLDCWSREIIALLAGQDELFTPLEKRANARGSLGFDPAASGIIREREEQLGVQLPASYRDFLVASNGWIQVGFDAEDAMVYPIEQVRLLRESNPDLIRDWSSAGGSRDVPDDGYFVYGISQDPVRLRDRYLQHAIQISEVVDAGVYLLNPRVVDASGEFEAWFLGWELPGAARFKSFADLMRNAYFLAANRPNVMYPYTEQQLSGTCADFLVIDRTGTIIETR